MSSLFSKPTGVRYVDMCIYIDKHIYEENRDDSTIFKYMCLLGKMLAYRQRYFLNLSLYEDFAYYFACSVYNRMMDPAKVRIKSVLNYMKSVLYFRKMAYEKEVYSQVIDPQFDKNWNSDKFKQRTLTTLELNNSELRSFFVSNALKSLPQIVYNSIPSIYSSSMRYKIYTSALLTQLSRYTLNNKSQEYFNSKLIDTQAFDVVNYLNKLFSKYDIILWHLPTDMHDVVKLVVNKANKLLFDTIYEIIGDFTIDSSTYLNMSNDLIFGGENEEY